jgi:hypothetical protein
MNNEQAAKLKDPDWQVASAYAYQCGIAGLAQLMYRVIKLEKALLDGKQKGKTS